MVSFVRILTVCTVGFGALTVPAHSSVAQTVALELNTEQDWQDINADQSRAALFDRFIRPRAEKPSGDLVPFSLSGPFVFPSNARFDDGQPRQNSIFGIDVSHHNGSRLNFSALKRQDVRYVYLKATQGYQFKDSKFAEFVSKIEGLPADQRFLKGAYHFLAAGGSGTPEENGTAQADSFIKYVGLHGGFQPNDMPPVVDLEWDVAGANAPDRWQGVNAENIAATALAFLKRVEEKTRRVPMVYTAVAFWNDRHIPLSWFGEKFGHYKLWIADYSSSRRAIEKPKTFNGAKLHIWQFTDRAKIAQGFRGGVDGNVYKGDEQTFLADFDLPK